MADEIISALAEQLHPVVENSGLYLQEIKVSRAGKHSRITVVIDLPEGPGAIGEEQLVAASRAVGKRLDEVDPLPEAYHLEVTTPGAERPLTNLREWGRAVGRTVEVRIAGTGLVKLELESVSDEAITGLVEGTERSFAFAQIESGRTVVAFGK